MVPKVNSSLLAQALETAGPKISAFTATLDEISSDIKEVEKLLVSSGFRLEVSVPLYANELFLLEDSEIGTDGFPTRGLAWCGGDDGNTWRIYYLEVYHAPSADSPPVTVEMCRKMRPLIETPVALRLKVEPVLAQLITDIGQQIPAGKLAPAETQN